MLSNIFSQYFRSFLLRSGLMRAANPLEEAFRSWSTHPSALDMVSSEETTFYFTYCTCFVCVRSLVLGHDKYRGNDFLFYNKYNICIVVCLFLKLNRIILFVITYRI